MPDETIYQKTTKRFGQLRDLRTPWEALWQDIADYVLPRREDIQQTAQQGKRQGVRRYDGTAISALQLMADGYYGYLVSPSLAWFRLKLPPQLEWLEDDYPEAREWLQECEKVLYSSFQRSTFYSAMSEYFLDAGSIGTATIYAEEHLEKDRIVYSCRHPAEIFIAEDRFGEVDTIYRRIQMTVRQMAQEFGAEALSEDLKTALESNPDRTFEIIHAVYPRTDRNAQKLDAANKKYASVYITPAMPDKPLRVSGYDHLPYLCWRYRKNTNETYGRSPASDALVDILTANQTSKTLLEAAHMSVEPPLNVPAVMKGRVRFVPRGMNYYSDPAEVISPIHTGISFPIGVDREQQIQRAIQDHFRVDFFLLLARTERQMTATEIIERQGEKAAVLGATIGRLNTECLDKTIDLAFDIEARAGRMPPPPPVLTRFGGARIEVDYMGPLAQAQRRLFRSQGVLRSLELVAPVFNIRPDAADIVDWDEAVRELLEVAGMPQKAIISKERLFAIRQARADAMAAEEQKRDLERMVGGIKTMAEADKASNGAVGNVLGEIKEANAV